mmetsp:Transcript_9777/g.16223  ORF Transcript_9777/g.16223 Transcript_9777/m.16223 type:complete len:200 (+) Transcript_9777:495-1094(+)
MEQMAVQPCSDSNSPCASIAEVTTSSVPALAARSHLSSRSLSMPSQIRCIALQPQCWMRASPECALIAMTTASIAPNPAACCLRAAASSSSPSTTLDNNQQQFSAMPLEFSSVLSAASTRSSAPAVTARCFSLSADGALPQQMLFTAAHACSLNCCDWFASAAVSTTSSPPAFPACCLRASTFSSTPRHKLRNAPQPCS